MFVVMLFYFYVVQYGSHSHIKAKYGLICCLMPQKARCCYTSFRKKEKILYCSPECSGGTHNTQICFCLGRTRVQKLQEVGFGKDRIGLHDPQMIQLHEVFLLFPPKRKPTTGFIFLSLFLKVKDKTEWAVGDSFSSSALCSLQVWFLHISYFLQKQFV